MDSNNVPPSLQIIRLEQVKKITGLSKSYIYQKEAEGLFPPRVHLTGRTVGWPLQKILDYNEAVINKPSSPDMGGAENV